MPSGSGPTSPMQAPTTAATTAPPSGHTTNTDTDQKSNDHGIGNESLLARQVSHDSNPYVQRSRVTRAAPPKPACNPLQFVQIKPCNLYQSAQQQLKRAEEVKKVKEVKKEEPEDWQSNLDNWKSCRRKRVEHIIDRVVEVKKLELEDHDKSRRKSKTFSEMLEERESKGRKTSLAVYAIDDDSNDFSDLGIGTSSASGKSSLSEDFDNHSVISDNQETEKHNSDIENHSNPENGHRDYVSSPGYDTSSSTAPASSPDPCEYTYEGAIQEYKSRVSRAHLSGFNGYNNNNNNNSDTNNMPSLPYTIDSADVTNVIATTAITTTTPIAAAPVEPTKRSISIDLGKPIYETTNLLSKRLSIPKLINERLSTFESRCANNANNNDSDKFQIDENLEQSDRMTTTAATAATATTTVAAANVNVLKRRELFEKEKAAIDDFNKVVSRVSEDLAASLSIKERLMNLEKRLDEATVTGKPDTNNGSTLVTSPPTATMNNVKNILQNIENGPASMGTNEQIVDEVTPVLVPPLPSVPPPLPPQQQQQQQQQQQPHNELDFTETKYEHCDETNETHLNSIHSEIDEMHYEDSGIHTSVEASIIQFDEHNDESVEQSTIEPATIIANNDNNITTAEINTIIGNTSSIVGTIEPSSSSINVIPDVIPIHSTNHPQTERTSATIIETVSTIDQCGSNNNDADLLEAIDDAEFNEMQNDASVIEALEQAFQAIDTEIHPKMSNAESTKANNEPIYENIVEINELYRELEENEQKKQQQSQHQYEEEPFYQVPKAPEPYYEVLKPKPIPLYENIEIFFTPNTLKMSTEATNGIHPTIVGTNQNSSSGGGGSVAQIEPPKEKPPPPPIDENSTDDDDEDDNNDNNNNNEHHESKPSNGNPSSDDNKSDAFKRVNSTRRIKKEIRSKRTSFLGIECTGAEDETFLEFTVAPPPDMAALIQEERRQEKQLYLKATGGGGLYDSSDTTESSRDSGVSENHSRQSSDPLSEEQDDYFVPKKLIANASNRTKATHQIETDPSTIAWNYSKDNKESYSQAMDEEARMRSLEDQIREQEEVLRVERELLQLEQEELKRQKDNLLLRENLARKELDQNAAAALRHSLQDITQSNGSVGNLYNSGSVHTTNSPNNHPHNHHNHQIPSTYSSMHNVQQCPPNYRQSMPNLQEILLHENCKKLPPIPPAKPQRSYGKLPQMTQIAQMPDFWSTRDLSSTGKHSLGDLADENGDSIQLRATGQNQLPGNKSRHTIHALSAVPKPKFQEHWVQTNNQLPSIKHNNSDYVNTDQFLRTNGKAPSHLHHSTITTTSALNGTHEHWYQNDRKSLDSHGFNYQKHWLIQEAEQMRKDQQQRANRHQHQHQTQSTRSIPPPPPPRPDQSNNGKPLPEAIIQTLTKRVQNCGLGERKRYDLNPKPITNGPSEIPYGPLPAASMVATTTATATTTTTTQSALTPPPPPPQITPRHNGHNLESPKEILSVSGKKKCSYCNEELGRGAAMIIESLQLFYHLDCFKCCVCRIQLGDGISGADVRVRSQKLHCHNCFSSDDGIKFSCV